MKKSFLTLLLLFNVVLCNAQVSKEEEFMRLFFEIVKKGDKKQLTDKLLLKESDLDTYTESQKALGSTKSMTKDEFAKFVDDKNKRIIRAFDDLIASATKAKITFENTAYSSYKKIADPNAEIPAGYYKIYFSFHNTYTFKIQLECCPLGDGYKIFNLQNSVTM